MKYIKNDSGVTKTWIGQQLADQEVFQIEFHNGESWSKAASTTGSAVETDILSGDIKVSLDNFVTTLSAAEGLVVVATEEAGILHAHLIDTTTVSDGKTLVYHAGTDQWKYRSHDDIDGSGTNTHAQIDTHISDTNNPHSVTKSQVGLGNADNTSDVNKPVSIAQQAAIDAAVVGLYDNKGGYNAATNSPDLDVSPSGIKNGDAYTVEVAGNFFTESVEVGDVLIAKQDDPITLGDWTKVNKNISFGTTAGTAAEGNHTHTASDVTDFDTEVSNNIDVAANTADRHSHANKAQLDLITDGDHDVRSDNPHSVTKTQVGLSNVPNTDATQRANHTGTQTASTISDFDTEVSNNTSVVANTAKVGIPAGGTTDQVLTKDTGTDYDVSWQTPKPPLSSIDFTWTDNGTPYFEVGANDTVWTTWTVFYFAGSTTRGTPTSVYAVGNCKTSGDTSNVRLRDVTNNVTICENLAIGHNGDVPTGWSLGAISNVPTGGAVWELQIKKNATSGDKMDLYAFHINFGE